ncbi:nuclear transport factor 2 family protein [Marinifilum breve]|nr:nuclear transport factor 2 family protein [Marinifilum breve]
MKKILIALIVAATFLAACNQEKVNELETLKKEVKMKNEIAERNKANSIAFLKALEAMDVNAVVALFAEDGVQINPYASGLFSDGVKGHDEIRKYWEVPFSTFPSMKFIIHETFAMEDPNRTLIRCKGKIEMPNNSGWYDNDYYLTFKFNQEGKITEYVEIFNPIVAARGFGLTDKIK